MGSNPIQSVAVLAAGLCVALAMLIAFHRRPRAAMAVWCGALFFTPVWWGASMGGVFITALTGVTILAIFSTIGSRLRWTFVDTVVALLFIAVLLALVFGGAIWGHVQDALTTWLLPYIWGRLVLSRVGADWIFACISVAALVASSLAIIEFLSGTNIFLLLPGASASVWGTQQIRAGLPRAEGAFGHSIALGGALAIATPFLLAVRWPTWLRAIALGVVGLAAAMTFSRLGLVGVLLSAVLAVIFLGDYLGRALRVVVPVMLAVGAVVGLPVILQVFSDAGSEAAGSAEYRVDLLPLVGEMVPLGVSPARVTAPTGEDYWGGFRSIDSALILIGLRFGFVPLIIVILLILLAAIGVGRGTTGPAGVAILGQVPALATVALITQYSAFVWFAAGLAAASYSLSMGRAALGRQIDRDRGSRELTRVV